MLIYWIRNDFRFKDNEAFYYFFNKKENKKCVYSYDDDKFKNRSAQKWWLYKTLCNYKINLEEKKIKFDFILNNEIDAINYILKKNSIKEIVWNKIFLPREIIIENKIINILKKKNISYKVFSSNLLLDPSKTRKKDNTPFQVFTPFWKNEEKLYIENHQYKNLPLKNNKNLKFKDFKEFEVILPNKKWFKKFEKYWNVGESEAQKKISEFKKIKINKYDTDRDIPSIDGTSRLSPHLAFGEISSRDIFDQYLSIPKKNLGTRKYINEIGWREFAYHLINHFPQIEQSNLRKNFDNFPWSQNKNHLKKWKLGETGYPIVDAAMRQLYETGWMHNRLRMVTGSFLVKHLRINWIEGEKYFKDTLLDYDTANNVAGWQWIAGCGADAAPYFRIFNPMTQGEKFDADGNFVKKWIPGLKNVPKKFIHKPWELSGDISQKINFDLKRYYFEPIVDHAKARIEALKAFEFTKK